CARRGIAAGWSFDYW
nr:immunoglobulin heavy chain junction region [Macaca mulatta]MOX61551.1 immunoglobulin heavy chain junction region [Macaca mulatta]MOX63212.1 immunoglobulin heavy chain junction region [Macaca mulatta]MOX63933.1 immunoglobulin heavy chain junction region [Macaca mulatta]MOX64550.1 immunoglobulin heavy chain junction region [Macaca mulatta]